MQTFTTLGTKEGKTGATDAPRWLSIQEATEEECHTVAAKLHVPIEYMTPVFNSHENPRVEGMDQADGAGLILVRCPYQTTSKNGERAYETAPVAIIIQEDLVTTVTTVKLSIHNRCVQLAESMTDPIVFSLAILNVVFGQFLNDTDQLAAQTASMEVRVGKASRNTLLYEIMAVEKSLVFFTSAMEDSKDIWQPLQNSVYFREDPNHRHWLRVAERRAHQAMTLAASTEAILDQYNSTVSSVVSNNLNQIMKLLTSVSIIMTIPGIVGSIWGMNTKVPWQQTMGGFWFLLVVTILLCVCTGYWLHKKDFF